MRALCICPAIRGRCIAGSIGGLRRAMASTSAPLISATTDGMGVALASLTHGGLCSPRSDPRTGNDTRPRTVDVLHGDLRCSFVKGCGYAVSCRAVCRCGDPRAGHSGRLSAGSLDDPDVGPRARCCGNS